MTQCALSMVCGRRHPDRKRVVGPHMMKWLRARYNLEVHNKLSKARPLASYSVKPAALHSGAM